MLAQCPECKALTDLANRPSGEGDRIRCVYCGNEFDRSTALTGRFVASGAEAPPQTQSRPRYRLRVAAGHPPETAPPGRPLPAAAGWGFAIILLLLLLAAQYAYIMRADLARHTALRPWLERLCDYAGCAIPLQRDPGRIRIIGRDVRRHPTVDDGLIVTVTFGNQAPFPQPYPIMQITFLDIEDRILARRRFKPEEYLPGDIDPGQGLKPGVPVQSVLEIVDPGRAAVNFRLRFL